MPQYEGLFRKFGTAQLPSPEASLAFPDRLPPELLSRIFLSLKYVSTNNSFNELFQKPDAEYSTDALDEYSTLELRSWRSVTQVCQYWRAVSLACPDLWTELAFSCKPEFTDLMLTRSKYAPLDIAYWIMNSNSQPKSKAQDKIIHNALSQVHRVRSVELRLSRLMWDIRGPSGWDDIFTDGHLYKSRSLDLSFASALSRLSRSAPILERLDLRASMTSASVKDGRLPAGFWTPGCAPRLSYLHLDNMIIEWSNLPLGPALRYLHLNSGWNHAKQPRPPLDAFLQTLALASGLERLELCNVLPAPCSVTDNTRRSTQPITMSNLKFTSRRESVQSVSEVLRWVRMPGWVNMVLMFTDASFDGDAAQAIEQCIANTGRPSLGIRNIRILPSSSEFVGTGTVTRSDLETFALQDVRQPRLGERLEIGFHNPPSEPDSISLPSEAAASPQALVLRSEVMDESSCAKFISFSFRAVKRHYDLRPLLRSHALSESLRAPVWNS